jgi:hypothetical protein
VTSIECSDKGGIPTPAPHQRCFIFLFVVCRFGYDHMKARKRVNFLVKQGILEVDKTFYEGLRDWYLQPQVINFLFIELRIEDNAFLYGNNRYFNVSL